MKNFCLVIFLSLFARQLYAFPIYTISVCVSASYNDAIECKDKYLSNMQNVMILKVKDGRYKTTYGEFSSYQEAYKFQKEHGGKVNAPWQFIITADIKSLKNEDVYFFNKIQNQQITHFNEYDKLLIEIDQAKNILYVNGVNSNKNINLKSYVVSTGKTGIDKPSGIGGITNIVYDPIWYPTKTTIESFKKFKGIDLPDAVPSGSPLNYLGPVKIVLTHKVKGHDVYRIHGTLSESTIGTHESGGCIRMKNQEAIELADILQKFANSKSFASIVVDIK
jgi:L,D-transpeptidase YcfS